MKIALTATAVACLSVCAHAVTLTVTAAAAPNIYGSPSWNDYNANAMYAIENGLNSYGSGVTGFYNTNGETWSTANNFVTNFSSWMGTANPGGSYAGEYGTRWHFGLHILGEGQQFSLSQLSFNMFSNEEPDLDYADDFIGLGFNARRIGIDYVDGIKGNGNDIIYDDGGDDSILIDELIYVGVGNAYAVYDNGIDPLQVQLDDAIGEINSYRLTTEYMLTIGGDVYSGSAFTNFEAVPEPATMVAVGLGGLVLLRKKRK